LHPAYVGIVDVAPANIGDISARHSALAREVGEHSQFVQVGMAKQSRSILEGKTFAAKHFVGDVINF
jgi:hypothetical protein